MVAKAKTDQELLKEIQVLRIQLQEAEETLHAIRSGEIDALVVKGPEGEQVFTLQGAEHPYRLMVETMRDGAVTTSVDGTIMYCNESFAAMIGKPLERVVGSSMKSYIADDDIPSLTALLNRGNNNSSKREIRLRSDAGTFVPVYMSANSLQLDEFQSLSIVVTDLTEHKHNEELIAARRVEQLLRKQSELARRHVAEILESITDSFIALDGEWRFTDLNQVASTTVFGKPREEILGRVFWELYPEAVEADFYRHFHKAVAEGHPVHFEATYSVAQNKWFETHAYPSPDGLSVYMRDITERKQAEEALQKNEELLRTLVQNLPNGSINVFDKDLRYLFAAGQGLAEVGLSTENLVGKTLAEVFPQESADKVAPYYRQAFAGNCVEFELEYGSHWYSINAAPLRSDLEIYAVIAVAQNITARKHAEEERAKLLASEHAARAEAEKANRLKDEFLATVSHELRNPLSAILGWSKILRSRPIDEEGSAHGLQVIERNARVQLKLIEDLLDVARIASGKLDLNLRELDLVGVIEGAVEAVRPSAEAKQIRLQSTFGAVTGIVKGDANRLQQVVGNLLSNAIKFTPPGGQVDVCLRLDGDFAVITVSDTGEGISPHFLPFVFDRFRQEDGSTTRVQAGLGLGLAIVRNLVELHGGTVTADSEGSGQGATFTVTLPLTKVENRPPLSVAASGNAPLTASTQSESRSPMLEGVAVLVVDDDRDNRELVKMVLTEHGARVSVAATAPEARSEIEREAPDVLVCDIGLPNEDGYELIRKVRSLAGTRGPTVPAVALTAYATPADHAKALAAGYQKHLAKPVEPSELLAAVAGLLGRS